MDEASDWEFPADVQPKPDDVAYDLDRTLDAVVGLRAEIPEDAFTAGILGTERAGNGIVIDSGGLVLTIGYLVAEAEQVWLSTNHGQALTGHVVAYDYDSGFGLVQAHSPPGVPPLAFGRSSTLGAGSRVVVAGHGGRRHALSATLVSRRAFAGYWEYVLDEALFTVPAHPNWGGTALIGKDGLLYGVGSLFVQNARGRETRAEGNMLVPIDLLPPLLEQYRATGTVIGPARPWLGIYVGEAQDRLVVMGLSEGGPAQKAGLEPGDIVVEVGGAPVGDLADLFRTIWDVGEAGVDVPVTVWRDGARRKLVVRSMNRNDLLRSPRLH